MYEGLGFVFGVYQRFFSLCLEFLYIHVCGVVFGRSPISSARTHALCGNALADQLSILVTGPQGATVPIFPDQTLKRNVQNLSKIR